MRSLKILTLVTLSLFFKSLQAQMLQPMNYKEYSFPWHVNIGGGINKVTDGSAYLELGKSAGSTKGFLPPRGNKASVVGPSTGLQFYDLGTGQPWWYNGTKWISWDNTA